ncbi:MAG TPA: anthranilate synthase component I family protein [Pyrinomonadaceae bacterium]|nr:anthranilate synthase component I family protein [Pyrinomonadaceae bacterium]
MDDFKEFKDRAKIANVVPVVETLPADLLTPLAVYLKLSHETEYSFLFESVEGGETLARYSFIGAKPHMIAVGGQHSVHVIEAGVESVRSISMDRFLREHFDNFRAVENADLPSFVGGAIGTLGFSCSRWFEPTLNSEIDLDEDDATMMFYRSIVAFDHARQQIKIISLAVFDDGSHSDEGELRRLYNAAVGDNNRVRKAIEHQYLPLPTQTTSIAANRNISSNWTKAEFESTVSDVKELINAGQCYQAVVSQCLSRPTGASPVSIYRAIRSLNPSPYMFLLKLGDKSIIGASPEMLVRSRGTRLEYRPIAGTRPRGKTAAEDDRLAEEMRNDPKEIAEHLMLVDLGRNDLGRVAEFGTVTVDALMNVEKYSHVQHLVSYLSAELKRGLNRFDALASCFPAGTVSGAPKVRAMEIIQELEPTPRGEYAGAIGYFDYAGNMDTCITIRTLVLENGIAKVQSGSGIVADSVPELEYFESMNKARALLKAVEIAEASNL